MPGTRKRVRKFGEKREERACRAGPTRQVPAGLSQWGRMGQAAQAKPAAHAADGWSALPSQRGKRKKLPQARGASATAGTPRRISRRKGEHWHKPVPCGGHGDLEQPPQGEDEQKILEKSKWIVPSACSSEEHRAATGADADAAAAARLRLPVARLRLLRGRERRARLQPRLPRGQGEQRRLRHQRQEPKMSEPPKATRNQEKAAAKKRRAEGGGQTSFKRKPINPYIVQIWQHRGGKRAPITKRDWAELEPQVTKRAMAAAIETGAVKEDISVAVLRWIQHTAEDPGKKEGGNDAGHGIAIMRSPTGVKFIREVIGTDSYGEIKIRGKPYSISSYREDDDARPLWSLGLTPAAKEATDSNRQGIWIMLSRSKPDTYVFSIYNRKPVLRRNAHRFPKWTQSSIDIERENWIHFKKTEGKRWIVHFRVDEAWDKALQENKQVPTVIGMLKFEKKVEEPAMSMAAMEISGKQKQDILAAAIEKTANKDA